MTKNYMYIKKKFKAKNKNKLLKITKKNNYRPRVRVRGNSEKIINKTY